MHRSSRQIVSRGNSIRPRARGGCQVPAPVVSSTPCSRCTIPSCVEGNARKEGSRMMTVPFLTKLDPPSEEVAPARRRVPAPSSRVRRAPRMRERRRETRTRERAFGSRSAARAPRARPERAAAERDRAGGSRSRSSTRSARRASVSAWSSVVNPPRLAQRRSGLHRKRTVARAPKHRRARRSPTEARASPPAGGQRIRERRREPDRGSR